MIQNKEDLNQYLMEDAKAARCGGINTIKGRLIYYVKLFVGSEDAHALRYLRTLRHYEYWDCRARSGGGVF